VSKLNAELIERRGNAGDLSLIAMNSNGQWGASTNIEGFSFAVTTESQEPIVYMVKNVNGKCIHEIASEEWLDEYMQTRTTPLARK
jgi:uncharacterized FlaG/YvyC family protein